MNLLIIGVTSSLFSTVLPKLSKNITIHTIIRNRDDLNEKQQKWRTFLKSNTVEFTDINKIDLCIYMSSVDDIEILQSLETQNIPILLIGSGAVIDWKHGRIPMNSYIEGKLRALMFATTTIHPGFYLPNAQTQDVGSGLHVDTIRKIFGDYDSTFNYEKSKYITSMDLLSDFIIQWIQHPYLYTGKQFAFGTPFAMSRMQIRENNTIEHERLYEDEMSYTFKVSGLKHKNITDMIEDARKWYKINK